jgi:enoyl-CoA hydratase/carnithine racemase
MCQFSYLDLKKAWGRGETLMDIVVHDHYRVLHLILNRPTKRNALTVEMCREIVAAVESAESRSDIGCTLISANGSVFCAGMDLTETPLVDEQLDVHEQLFTLGARAQKPIVVAVNGAALAGGLGLVAQGHVVLASPNAVFSLPEVRIGFWPFVIYRAMEGALGSRRTLELSLTGTSFHAQQALDWGLVHQIHPVAEIHDASKSVAREIAKSSQLAIAAGLRYVREVQGKSEREAGEIASRLRAELMASADYKEGAAAFREKREPHWPSMPLEFYAKHSGPADHS